MREVCAKMVLRPLNDDLKGRLMCQNVINRLQTETDLFREVITDEEMDFGVQYGNQVSVSGRL